MINGDLTETASHGGAGDGREPLSRDGVGVDPPAHILGRQTNGMREVRDAEPLDDWNEEHGGHATRNVSHVNMTGGEISDSPQGMEPGERLRQRRTALGLSVEQLAVKGGFAPSTVRAHENGQNGIRLPAARKYARALSTTPEWIMFEAGAAESSANDSMPSARMVPILGQVQAGAYLEIPEEPEPAGFLPFYDPRYARATIYALRVVGRSMDVHYPDGATVYVVPAAEAGIREGDHVVVRRERAGLYETTLKEIFLQDGKMALRPRSNDPAHQEVLVTGDDWPEVIAVVVGSYVPATPRSAHVLMGGGN